MGARGGHTGSERTRAIKKGGRADSDAVRRPMGIGLYADPFPNGQARQPNCQVAVYVADPVRAEVGHQTGCLGNHHRPNELRVWLPRHDVNSAVVEALSRIILMISG